MKKSEFLIEPILPVCGKTVPDPKPPPVRKPDPPPDPTRWSAHPIDGFLAASWREHGLTPAPEADRRTLIRRLAFDLTRIPPTPEAAAAAIALD